MKELSADGASLCLKLGDDMFVVSAANSWGFYILGCADAGLNVACIDNQERCMIVQHRRLLLSTVACIRDVEGRSKA